MEWDNKRSELVKQWLIATLSCPICGHQEGIYHSDDKRLTGEKRFLRAMGWMAPDCRNATREDHAPQQPKGWWPRRRRPAPMELAFYNPRKQGETES